MDCDKKKKPATQYLALKEFRKFSKCKITKLLKVLQTVLVLKENRDLLVEAISSKRVVQILDCVAVALPSSARTKYPKFREISRKGALTTEKVTVTVKSDVSISPLDEDKIKELMAKIDGYFN